MKTQLTIRLPRLRFHYFVALVVLIPYYLSAQNSGEEQGYDTIPLRFELIGSEQGIPHNTVRSLYQDRLGFIWMSSPNGLIKYDGNEFQTFPHRIADSSRGVVSPASIYFTAPVEDPNGDLWIGARGDTPGQPVLFFFDRETEKLLPLPFLPAREIPDLEKSIWGIHIGHHYLWVLSDRLYRLALIDIDGNSGLAADASFEAVELEAAGAGEVELTGIYGDSNGRIWLTGRGGLYQWLAEPDTFRFFPITLPESAKREEELILTKLSETAAGAFWLFPAIYQKGYAIHFDPETGTYEFVTDEDYRFGNFMEKGPAPEELWFGTHPGKGKLTIFNTRTRRLKTVDIQVDGVNFLVTTRIESLLRDRSGNMWIAIEEGGLLKFDPLRNNFHWLHFQPGNPNSPSHDAVTGLGQDQNGKYWISTYGGGLHRWDRESNTVVNYRTQPGNPDSPLSNYLLGLEVASDGKIWYGEGFSAGYYDPASGRFGHYRESGTVFSVYEDERNRLWLAKYGGGLRGYDSSSDEFIKIGIPDPADPDKLMFPYMGGIFQDSHGYLWLGSYAPWIGGFFRFDPETQQFDIFDLPEAHDFCEDRRGLIWIASVNGLYRFNPETEEFLRYEEADGLASNIVQTIEEDHAGRLWIATDNGLSRFDPATNTFRNYFQSDGLPANKFYYPSYQNQAGELFFWGEFGLLYFHPDSIRNNTIPPKLAFTGLDLFGEPVPVGTDTPLDKPLSFTRQIDLSHWQNDLTIHYAALHFKNPEKNSYQVKLDNYDDAWRDAGQQRFADYTNLDPGRYTFRVRAANSDGVWSEEDITLTILIRPPWYWNAWSQLLYALLLAGALYGLYRFQLNRRLAMAEAVRLRELDEFKSRFYTNITHEFRTPLTVIQGMTGVIAEKATDKFNPEIDSIQRNSQQLLDQINRLLDLSKLDAGKLDLDLVQDDILPYLRYLTESFHSFALNQKINLHFYSEEEAIIMDFDPEKMMQVLSNLLSNALKFTPEYGKVQVVARKKTFSGSPHLELTVRDTGVGIPAKQLSHIFDRFYQADDSPTRRAEGTGIGLALAREFIDLMDGKISVNSEPDQGTTFRILLPIRREAEKTDSGPNGQVINRSDGNTGAPEKTALGQDSPAATLDFLTEQDAPLLLIVEDNADVRHYLTSCLQESYRLLYARNGREGIEQAREHVPDIVISDVMMPEVDGFELCHTLKTDERTSHIPIILLTAKADIDSKVEGLETGADAYLVKPFIKRELLVRLDKLIEGRRRLQQRYQLLDPLTPTEDPRLKREDAFLQKVRQAVENNLENEHFKVKDLCRAVGVSRVQLYRKLKALTGRTPADVIQTFRLQRARHLLHHTDLLVGEVAAQVGFKNHSHFTKSYKEAFGELPSQAGK